MIQIDKVLFPLGLGQRIDIHYVAMVFARNMTPPCE